MPLPASSGKTYAWPPKELNQIGQTQKQWAAWWSSEVGRLQEAYGGGVVADSTGYFASDPGGYKPTLGQRFVRWFVGEPTRGPDRNTKLIIPIAAEMAQASADLLFSDPPKIRIETVETRANKLKMQKAKAAESDTDTEELSTRAPGQDRLDELLDEGFYSTLAEGAESCAAIGGVFMRVSWDDKLKDKPFLSVRDADSAFPTFSFGILVSVTFWDVVGRDKQHTFRLLECHELDPITGNGLVRYGLFEGDDDFLGDQVPVSSRSETAPLNPVRNPALRPEGLDVVLDTKTPRLAVEYVPNQKPNRLWRQHPIGRWLGRSDFDGVEHLMDQLAEAMSAWMRAIRLGKARIMMGKELLKSTGPGSAMVMDLDQEAFVKLETLGGKEQSVGDQIQLVQPKIDVASHQATAAALTEDILQMAGYSMQTFGVGDTGTVRTATEIESKERRSLMTRDRKIRAWKPAIRALVCKMIDTDNQFFQQSTQYDSVDVNFADGVQETQLALAQTVQALFAGESASLEKRVRIVNPDMDDDDLKEEIELVRKEFAPAPLPTGVDPFGPDPTDPNPTPIPQQGQPGGPSAT